VVDGHNKSPVIASHILLGAFSLFPANILASDEPLSPYGLDKPILIATLLIMIFLCIALGFAIVDRSKTRRLLRNHRENESRLRACLDNIPDRVWLKDGEGRYMVVNAAWCRIFNLRESDVIGRKASEIFPMGIAKEFYKEEILVMEGNKQTREEQHLSIDGRERGWFDVFRVPVFDEAGTVAGIAGIARDITDRKQAEETLRESEERFRLLFANSADGILMTSPDGAILAANGAACIMFGRTEEELRLVGRDGIVDFSDLRFAASIEMRQKTGISRSEHLHLRKDGTKFLGEIVSNLFTDKSGERMACTIVRDITEQRRIEEAFRESERRLSSLVSNLPGVVFRCKNDPWWTMEFISEGCVTLTGYTASDLIGNLKLAFNDLIVPEDREAVWSVIQTGLHKQSPYQVAYRIRTSVGSVKWVWEQGSGVYDAAGEITGLEGFITDVTSQKKAEEELQWKTAFLEAQAGSSLDGILVVDKSGKKILQNRRAVDLFGIPESITKDSDDEVLLRWVAGMVKNPEVFLDKVYRLYSRPDEVSRDEVELKDGRTLDRYTAPVIGSDGTYYGRIWVFRDITEHKENQKVLEELSMTDGLTGISNRYRFDEVFEREWRRTMRSHSPLSLILMDIDFFKAFNDNYGHLAGDDCLRRVAQSLGRAARRTTDLVARYGGEEFAFLLPDTDSAGAVAVARQIRENMDSLNIPHPYSTVADRVTLSMGLATVIPDKGEALSDLIKLADDLLYKAKANGRNQVRVSLTEKV
jgi:diguanylate cyclase (GGDEF)-like protein/PAS domain S-box-containing protein